MEQFKKREATKKIINLKLSTYDKETLIRNAKKSGFDTYSEYIRWMINRGFIRKPRD